MTLGKSEVEAFLNHLADQKKVAGSTQAQALNALVFLYKDVLEQEIGWMENLRRIKRYHHIPTVLTHNEIKAIFTHMQGTPKLMAQLIYGSGLRVLECMSLRVKDVNFEEKNIIVRAAKGGKDRTTFLPSILTSAHFYY